MFCFDDDDDDDDDDVSLIFDDDMHRTRDQQLWLIPGCSEREKGHKQVPPPAKPSRPTNNGMMSLPHAHNIMYHRGRKILRPPYNDCSAFDTLK